MNRRNPMPGGSTCMAHGSPHSTGINDPCPSSADGGFHKCRHQDGHLGVHDCCSCEKTWDDR
jgi:hypothetical protein